MANQTFQILNQLIEYCQNPELRSCLLIGGHSIQEELKSIKKKQPTIIIGTPGKINEVLITRNVFKLKELDILIFDEADKYFHINILLGCWKWALRLR